MNAVYLSLGSNLGDKAYHLNEAIAQLSHHPKVEVCAISSFYKTAPVGYTEQDWFLNAAVQLNTSLDAHALLDYCQSIEKHLKRQRIQRWGPRTLDIDILLFGEETIQTPELTVPHPHMHERAFVLVPLQEIAPALLLNEKTLDTHLETLGSQDVSKWAAGHLVKTAGIHQMKLEKEWDGNDLLQCFQSGEYRSLLHSSMQDAEHGRYSIFCCDPHLIFKSKGNSCLIYENGQWSDFRSDPLIKLQALLNRYTLTHDSGLPFVGGAIGYFSYDLCHQIESLPRHAIDDRQVPDMHLCFYDGAIVVDHVEACTHIVGAGLVEDAQAFVEKRQRQMQRFEPTSADDDTSNPSSSAVTSNMTRAEYIEKVQRIKEYIRSGDIYQVNLAQRFETAIEQSPESLYRRLSTINPAPFSGFLEFDEGTVLSSSPESFLKTKGNTIITRPIKGTRPRGKDDEEDERFKEALLASEKEKAELLMIVDLERNDLGRICQNGSVKVTHLYEIETYETVHHLVGEVTGTLKADTQFIDIVKGTFPGGSITGAPKIRAMEIIDSLEPHQRNLFTGSLGYIGYDGEIQLNIAIRTLLVQKGRAYLQVGAGIVWDSQPESEYEETLHKAKALFETLNVNH